MSQKSLKNLMIFCKENSQIFKLHFQEFSAKISRFWKTTYFHIHDIGGKKQNKTENTSPSAKLISLCIKWHITYHDSIGFPSFSNFLHLFSFKEQFNFVPENVLEQKSISISNLFQAISKLCHYISKFFHWFSSFWLSNSSHNAAG